MEAARRRPSGKPSGLRMPEMPERIEVTVRVKTPAGMLKALLTELNRRKLKLQRTRGSARTMGEDARIVARIAELDSLHDFLTRAEIRQE